MTVVKAKSVTIAIFIVCQLALLMRSAIPALTNVLAMLKAVRSASAESASPLARPPDSARREQRPPIVRLMNTAQRDSAGSPVTLKGFAARTSARAVVATPASQRETQQASSGLFNALITIAFERVQLMATASKLTVRAVSAVSVKTLAPSA